MTSRDLSDGALGRHDGQLRDEHSPPSPAHTPSLGGLDLDALEKVAREALANKPHAQAWETHLGTLVRHASPAYSEHVATARAAQVAEHIAAFDPPTALRLIELARAAPPQPEPRDGALETATVEAVAQAIYEQWADQEGYVPWAPRGNSLKQEDARDLARKALTARDGASEGGALDREAVARIIDPWSMKQCEWASAQDDDEARADQIIALASHPAQEKELADPHRVKRLEAHIAALIMLFLDGDNEGLHGGDHDDPECPTCQVIARAQSEVAALQTQGEAAALKDNQP